MTTYGGLWKVTTYGGPSHCIIDSLLGFQKLQVPKECLEVTFSDDDSAELLISRPCGQGIYVYSLIAHLIYAHNEFVAKYSETVAGETSDNRSHARNW